MTTIVLRVDTVPAARERLMTLQVAIALALRTLDKAETFDDAAALSGVCDIFRAAGPLLSTLASASLLS
jgi:hypothetical protein